MGRRDRDDVGDAGDDPDQGRQAREGRLLLRAASMFVLLAIVAGVAVIGLGRVTHHNTLSTYIEEKVRKKSRVRIFRRNSTPNVLRRIAKFRKSRKK